MGANAYSVIELKMVETILSDKVEERRRLFEEAAGVTKYKARRKEALRKLGDVDSDLLRVEDIITEVGKTVNSSNRQAKKPNGTMSTWSGCACWKSTFSSAITPISSAG